MENKGRMADATPRSTEDLLKDFMKEENFDVLKLIRDTNLTDRLAISAFLSEDDPCAHRPAAALNSMGCPFEKARFLVIMSTCRTNKDLGILLSCFPKRICIREYERGDCALLIQSVPGERIIRGCLMLAIKENGDALEIRGFFLRKTRRFYIT